MNSIISNRILPYEADYAQLDKYRKIGVILLWIITALSIIIPVLEYFFSGGSWEAVFLALNLCYCVLIVFYYIIDTYTETFLYPATARKRRKGFIDNSLGSKFLFETVTGYYSNDSIEEGPYKMIVNCAENCFFTMNIAKKMRKQVVVKNAVLFLAFIVIAYFGMRSNPGAIPVLQALLSSMFLTELVHHLNFCRKLEDLFERFRDYFDSKSDTSRTLQEATLFLLDYETTLAYNKAPLSDSIYKENNEKWTKEWEALKKRYDIH